MSKQARITIETDSLLILQGRIWRRAWCPQCGAERNVIALEDIGVLSNLGRSALQEWLNSRGLHRSQTADGTTLICLNSLFDRVQK